MKSIVFVTVVTKILLVHTKLGPGLQESAYEACLAYELRKRGLQVRTQACLPITYKDVQIKAGYRLDLLVESQIIAELKAVEKMPSLHDSQLLSHLKLSGKRLSHFAATGL